ncbi:MAG: DUF4231 domain-containing protein [Deltaproteobacteria bacterium]|nr:DUF4231 domain-containing protein [Deltaproteobacteria bacterium]
MTHELSSPPRAPLAFRVAIVGHRPHRLQFADQDALAKLFTTLLVAVREEVVAAKRRDSHLYDDAAPVLRAVSPLAEGSDRLFAEAAIDLGFELCCVMPFPREEFSKDFERPDGLEENSLARFDAILARAAKGLSCFELDGRRRDGGAAYGEAGRVVLNQSDLLFVVWDGERRGKRGGTEDTFDEARRRGVPTVWIDAHAPHEWQMLRPNQRVPAAGKDGRVAPPTSAPGTPASLDPLRETVRQALALPEAARPPASADLSSTAASAAPSIRRFYRETWRRWNVAFVWKVLRDVVADRTYPSITLRVKPFEEAVLKDWPDDRSTPTGRIVDTLRPYYAWSDKLAERYADTYRSAFATTFLLAASVVGISLFPVAASLKHRGSAATFCIAVELGGIVAILAVVGLGRGGHWHQRWLDYRLVAELVRHLRLVVPLGGERPFPQVPAQWTTYGSPGSTWMAWYVRAIERLLGLPSARLDTHYVLDALEQLEAVLRGQVGYHQRNARRALAMEFVFQRTGLALFGLTFLACLLHFWPRWPEHWTQPLIFVGGFFPALGAALAGIANQAEFTRLEKRSEAMHIELERLADDVAALRAAGDPAATQNLESEPSVAHDPSLLQDVAAAAVPLSNAAVACAERAARLLVNEVLDWRVVFLDRPLNPPT